jgi:BASS family bile acid:Na+ symporter
VLSHADVETYLVPLQLATAMFGMGATLGVSDFLAVTRDPRGLALGLGLQLVFVPLLAVAFIAGFDLGPGWAVGLCLVAAVPGGAFSNLLTFLGRGNVALSISVTVCSTALCVLTVPALLRLLVSSSLPASFVFPLHRVVIEIGAYLLGPLLLGMAVFRVAPRWSPALARLGIRAAVVLIVVIALSAMGSGRIKIPEYGWTPPLIIVLFGVALAVLTPQISRLFGRFDDDTLALGVEVTVRNIGVALLVVHFFFPGLPEQGQVLYTCLFYAGASGLFALPLVILHRFGGPLVLLRGHRRRPAGFAD